MISHRLNEYIESITSSQNPVLEEIERSTNLRTTHPRMLSGKVQGKFLEIISSIINPERILEIGSFTGYSAICLAKGLKPGGILYTLEANEEIIPLLENNIKKSGLSDKIRIILGDATNTINNINEKFDLVFIDGDKRQYSDYYKIVLPKVKKGGLIIADNILWSGKLVEDFTDKESKSIFDFNQMIADDPNVEQVALSVRDGLLIIRKI